MFRDCHTHTHTHTETHQPSQQREDATSERCEAYLAFSLSFVRSRPKPQTAFSLSLSQDFFLLLLLGDSFFSLPTMSTLNWTVTFRLIFVFSFSFLDCTPKVLIMKLDLMRKLSIFSLSRLIFYHLFQTFSLARSFSPLSLTFFPF